MVRSAMYGDTGSCHTTTRDSLAFHTHWPQMKRLIINDTQPYLDTKTVALANVHFGHTVAALLSQLSTSQTSGHNSNRSSSSSSDTLPELVQLLLDDNVLSHLVSWCVKAGSGGGGRVQMQLLQLFRQLVASQWCGQLLVCDRVLQPLEQLLTECAGCDMCQQRPAWHRCLVMLIDELCRAVSRDNSLLAPLLLLPSTGKRGRDETEARAAGGGDRSDGGDGICGSGDGVSAISVRSDDVVGDGASDVVRGGGDVVRGGGDVVRGGGDVVRGGVLEVAVSLLVRHLQWDGAVGSVARDSLLLLVQLSSRSATLCPPLCRLLADSSDFCLVLAAGLGGLYSALPRVLDLFPGGGSYCQLHAAHCKLIPQLDSFLLALEFCDTVLSVCTPELRQRLADLIQCAFLVPVLSPALMEGTMEEKMTGVAYLELFLLTARHRCLVRVLLHFVCRHEHDHQSLLACLLAHIGASTKLCVVTLSLLHTLLDFNCEDVLLQLALLPLLPASHVMLSQRRRHQRHQLHGLLAGAEQLLALRPLSTAAAASEWPCRPEVLAQQRHVRRRVAQCRRACANWSTSYCWPTVDTPDSCAVASTATAAAAETFSVLPLASSEETAWTTTAPLAATGLTLADEDANSSLDDTSSGYYSFNLRCTPSPPAPHHPHSHPKQQQQQQQAETDDSYFHQLITECPSPLATGDTVSLGQVVSGLDRELTHFSDSPPPPPPPPVSSESRGDANRAQVSELNSYAESAAGTNRSPDIGVFLRSLFALLSHAVDNSFDVNVQLLCLLSRLCVYPQPVLSCFLLDATLTLQPSVPSLLQCVAELKVRLQQSLGQLDSVREQLLMTQQQLLHRATSCATASCSSCTNGHQPLPAHRRPYVTDVSPSSDDSVATPRVRLTKSLNVMAAKLASKFGRSAKRVATNNISSAPTEDTVSASAASHRSLLQTAVLMEHWLCELAAIAGEHALSATGTSTTSAATT